MGGMCAAGIPNEDLVKPEAISDDIRALNFIKGKELIHHLKMYNVKESPKQRTIYYDGFLNLEVMMYNFMLIPIQKNFQDRVSVLELSYSPPHFSASTGPIGPKTLFSLPGSPKSKSLISGQIVVPFNLSSAKVDKIPDQQAKTTAVDNRLAEGLNELLQKSLDPGCTLDYIKPTNFSSDLRDFCKRDPSVFCTIPGDLTPAWISQAIGVLLERPVMLKPFLAKNEDPGSNFLVPLCIQGVWRKVQVDENLAVSSQTMRLLFSLTLNGETWPHYLEKAYLKSLKKPVDMLARTYAVPYAVQDMTGAPYQEIFFKKQGMDMDHLERTIEKYLKRQFIICFAIDREFDRDPMSQLFSSTVYTLTQQIQMTSGVAMYSMRLSWSPSHEPLPFSQNRSMVITQSNLSGTQLRDTGSFFMKLSDLYKYFDVMQVYHFCPTFTQFCIQLETKESNFSYVEIDITRGGNVYFQLCQQEHMSGDASANQQRYELTGIAVFQRNKLDGIKSLNLIFQNSVAERDSWVASYLEPGNYFLIVAMPNIDQYRRRRKHQK